MSIMLLNTLFGSLLLCTSPTVTDSVTTTPNDYVVVQHINLQGNKRTKPFIIFRELDIKEGDTLRKDELAGRLEQNQRKIFNLNLFVTTTLSLENQKEHQADLRVEVKEQWYVFPIPYFYWADRNFNEWYYENNADLRRLTFGVSLRYRNVRGRAEELRLTVEHGFTNSYEFQYRIPYIDKQQKTGLNVGISYNTNKTLRYKTEADKLVDVRSENILRDRFFANLTLRRRNHFYDFQTLDFRYVRNHIADTIAQNLNPNYFLDKRNVQQFFQLNYTYTYDFRDRFQYALRGYLLSIQAIKYGLLSNDNLNMAEFSVDYFKYLPLGKHWYLTSFAELKTSVPSRQPFLQTRGLGYLADFVRGYELYAIDGQHYGYLKTTLKYQVLNRTFNFEKLLKIKQFSTIPLELYPSVFLDFGYVQNKYNALNNSHLANTLLVGYGFGFDMVTYYNSVFRINYAFNQMGERGIRFNLSKEF